MARRRRERDRQALELVLERPAFNRSVSLGVQESLLLTQQMLCATRADRVVTRLRRLGRGWHLETARAAALEVESGPWERIGLRTPTGHAVLWIIPATAEGE